MNSVTCPKSNFHPEKLASDLGLNVVKEFGSWTVRKNNRLIIGRLSFEEVRAFLLGWKVGKKSGSVMVLGFGKNRG